MGFFDIIGYSAFVDKNRNRFEEGIRKISRFIELVSSSAGTDIYATKLDHWVLSDSIILVIDTNRHPVFIGSLVVFLDTCSSIMRYGMTEGFPLRGAVGGGDFYKDGEVMMSSALVNAAHYEKKQEWLGTVLTPEALRVVEKAKNLEIQTKGKTKIDLESDRFNHSVRSGKIPWKKVQKAPDRKAFPEETYYIKPFEMSEKDWAKDYLPEYFDVKGQKKKIDNSNVLYALK